MTFTPLGFTPGVDLPAREDLILVKVDLEPGAVSNFDESDPAGGMLYVESGDFTIVNTTSSWSVTRGRALRDAISAGSTDANMLSETTLAGQEATLAVGDAAYVPSNVWVSYATMATPSPVASSSWPRRAASPVWVGPPRGRQPVGQGEVRGEVSAARRSLHPVLAAHG